VVLTVKSNLRQIVAGTVRLSRFYKRLVKEMQVKALATAAVFAACFAISGVAAPAPQAPTQHAKKRQVQVEEKKQPTWEECYAMSRQRGFDHDIEEWLQSIKDCQEGKIPL